MNNGFIRVAAATLPVVPGSPAENAQYIIESARHLAAQGVRVAVMPELGVTGYTCADLFHDSTLLGAADEALDTICKASKEFPEMLLIVGAPIRQGNSLYNCGVAIANGRKLCCVPKTYLPNYNEFYEHRWFDSGPVCATATTRSDTPFGNNLLIEVDGVKMGIEICEDLWTPIPPSSRLALAGAEIIVNLSASDDLIGKYDYLKGLISRQSASCVCAYAYASAGFGESSTDLVFDGKAFVAENGTIMAATERWQNGPQYAVADIDIEALRHDRMHKGSFHQCATANALACITIGSGLEQPKTVIDNKLLHAVNPRPFVPSSDAEIDRRATETIHIQAAGLARRLDATHCRTLVVGVSGGLDSTLALLVAVKAFDRLGLPRKGIIGITMPGFGTTDRTHTNALMLMKELGVSSREINISKAVMQHFADIGHDPKVHDVTYENSQARERTQILMDVANQEGGMVLGTGDLSELALGWATYNGDQMSMYGVNASVPKTLVKYLVEWFASRSDNKAVQQSLRDIIDTPISPELIPADSKGNITQKTEDLVGPYELHDFFLYYMLRFGFTPSRIYFLARHAFEGTYTNEVILHWMQVFYRRFFSQQFKRSCMPDGPKVGSVCLSPRGDWRMPSDASSALWLKEVDSLRP